MRATIVEQLPLMPAAVEHVHAEILRRIDAVLEGTPTIAALAYLDLSRGGRAGRGRPGMSGDRVVRVFVLKRIFGLSYEDLAFALADSRTYRAFCRLGMAETAPGRSVLQSNVKLLSPATLELINRELVKFAIKAGVDRAERVRGDCTVVEANIHPPTDSSLMWDTVRTLTRLMRRANGLTAVSFDDRSSQAKQTNIRIFYGHKGPERDAEYAALLEITEAVCHDALEVSRQLRALRCERRRRRRGARLAAKLVHFVELGLQVLEQTRRRVIEGEKVGANEKIVSIFEPHTDIIVPAARRIVFGHKIAITVGESALVLDAIVERGAPADVTLTSKLVQRTAAILGRAPRQVVFDGAFASRENLLAIKALGVQDVVFSKSPPNVSAREMTKSPRTHHLLKKFRAGIEGCISFLKRGLGLDRCTWRSEDSFSAYVWSGVIGANLLTIARHLIDAT